MTPERLVLAGIAVGTLLGAIQSYLIIRFQIGQALISFTAGSTAKASWPDLALITPFVIGAVALAIAISPQITMLGLGEEVAVSLGVKLGRVKALATVVVFVLTALPILVIGPVGFVGLVTPHAVRKLAGVDYRHIIPLCAVYGSVLVVAADLAARLILRPAEVPVGLIFPLIGVPYFIYLARKTRKEFQ
jgi:iron complex transport system permease protein